MINYLYNIVFFFFLLFRIIQSKRKCPYERDLKITKRIEEIKEITSFISNCENDKEYYNNYKNKCIKQIKKQPKVTAIVPVYNVGDYITDCINSIRNQTLKKIEIIAIDDGSTDNSGSILDKLKKEDKRLKVVHVKNAGVSCARNLGIDLSKGKYIAFIDGDDFMHRVGFKTAYKYAKKDNLDFITYKKRYYHGELPDTFFFSKDINTNDSMKIYRTKKEIFENFQYSSCNGLYKADIIRRNNIRLFPYLSQSEDGMFNIIFYQYINSLKNLDGKFYSYRLRRAGQATGEKREDKFHGVNGRYGEKHLSKLLLKELKKKRLLKGNEHIFLDFLFNHYILRRYHALYLVSANEILDGLKPYISDKNIIKKCNYRTRERIDRLKEYAKLDLEEICKYYNRKTIQK